MGVRVFISLISGNKEVKKRQQRVCMILESKHIPYEVIDITEPGKESEKEFMQQNSNAKDAKHPLPPQIFNDETYCGDYDEFDLANENDELEKFLKVPASSASVENGHVANGNTSSREPVKEEEEVVAKEEDDGEHEEEEE
ncbi:SH3 domain-binding glutamic acid-rich protein homolog isoform X2 [Macrosteles quadrilineatus]|uniref:SH3 domain-binding glutamic acid-rich protein homolog isoform X2 n=1 Tax=Macrosteles quadrilineatus TaxID=74068 RepID=UPI0023E2D359|nr:SH3 domain-binding glutamic acid-rich protein homolog isoform X2 [Macrosteles quadrilineatus]